ncbi:arylamine N-acetyltransferase family protein [Actinocrispum wychmicini]|uniref:N-hydroxyarylamine O-acetyltransferase n=1 Tax=Actinocrispum wychmicini TaxID=1213861 RepID=A0A4R2JEA5_9PSEU|nr:arylamine N-acetyltransferase [Actinocrispum wychmicini]TCO52585.1 N-hydroxyarylamine O-acetyltransferase [Actinocrispum wychmicini]
MTDWGIEQLDLDAYLARIGVEEPTLKDMHAGHLRSIPFENITVTLGETPALDLPSLQAKMVDRRRGGYCYEHNSLYAAALERVGVPVTRLLARSLVNSTAMRPRTHMVLLATVDGERYLTDVGWGGSNILEPVPLRETETRHGVWTHRLTRDEDVWILQDKTADGWQSLYQFAIERTYPADLEMANHYTSTWPRSAFRNGVVAQRSEAEQRRMLRGDELTVVGPEGVREQRTLTRGEVLDTLTKDFGIELNHDETTRLPLP